MNNKTTLYSFIIDRSGSMTGMEQMAVNGFNDHLKTIQNLKIEFPEQEFICSLTTFNHEVETIVDSKPITQIAPIEIGQYKPSGTTALLDAIGKSMHDVNETYQDKLKKNEMSVVFVIITDGYENASRFFSYHDIARKISDLEKTNNWTFTFLGADFDAFQTSKMLNIKKENVMNFQKDAYYDMASNINLSMRSYSESKDKGIIKQNFFEK